MIDFNDKKNSLKYQIGKLDHCHYILITTYCGNIIDQASPAAPAIPIDDRKTRLDPQLRTRNESKTNIP